MQLLHSKAYALPLSGDAAKMETMTEAQHSSSELGTEERDGVREQLERMLETHHFRQSRRYPALLRFIVEETLEGRGDLLKERILGVEVFGRDPSYDTSSDPVVRVTIAEIRKRIAQYYHDELHDAEIRIELPSGHYVAEFHRGRKTERDASTEEDRAQEAELPWPAASEKVSAPETGRRNLALSDLNSAPPPTSLRRPVTFPVRKLGLWSAVLIVLATITGTAYRETHPPALDQLWAPLLRSSKQVLISIPTDVGRHHGALTTPADLFANDSRQRDTSGAKPEVVTFLDHETNGENVVFSDALATIKIAHLIASQSRDFRVKLNVTTTLDDLRQGPAVLIGGLDNQWTLQAIAPLPFRFEGNDEQGYWISDARHPTDRSWFLNLKQEYAKVTLDYALVARVHDRQTGQPEMIVAGIGMSGTMAAGEFVVSPDGAEELQQRIGPGLRNRDFEAVLSTNVINGVAGAPHILQVWVE